MIDISSFLLSQQTSTEYTNNNINANTNANANTNTNANANANANITYFQEELDEDKEDWFDNNITNTCTSLHRAKKKQRATLKRQSFIMKMNTLNTKFKKPKKSVRFNSITYTATTATTSNDDITNSSWYDKTELMQFRQSAVDLAVFQHKRFNGDDTKLPRGMEAMSKRRRKHKAITMKYMLLAIRRSKTPQYVSSLSKKLGSWNTEIAIRDACIDYFDIYEPQLIHNIPSVSSNPPTISLVLRTNSADGVADGAADGATANGATADGATADGNAATRRQRSSSSTTTATSTTATTQKRGWCIDNRPSPVAISSTSALSSASNHHHHHHQRQQRSSSGIKSVYTNHTYDLLPRSSNKQRIL
jgi:hypothetical protein